MITDSCHSLKNIIIKAWLMYMSYIIYVSGLVYEFRELITKKQFKLVND